MEYTDEINRVLSIESEAINTLKNTLDFDVLKKIVDLLCTVKTNKNKVVTAGCGTSSVAAKKIAHSLCCVEIPAFFLSPADAVHGAMGSIQKGDIVVLVSKGGNTSEILNYIPCCKEKGANIIGVSEDAESILAKKCDIYLKVKVEMEPCRWGLLATASTMAVIATWDAIIITAMQLNSFTKEQFLLIHPGGDVGKKLYKTYHRTDNLPDL